MFLFILDSIVFKDVVSSLIGYLECSAVVQHGQHSALLSISFQMCTSSAFFFHMVPYNKKILTGNCREFDRKFTDILQAFIQTLQSSG